MPESKDTDWDWQDFLNRNNNELVATWGNLANRMLSFAGRHWEGHVPEPGELRAEDREILATVEAGFETVGNYIDTVRLRFALFEAIRLATEVNKYLDKTAPWFEIKTDKAAAATTVFTALRAIDSLKVLLSPFLPFTCERLHSYLGYTRPLFGALETETRQDTLGEHTVLRYLPGEASGKWEPSQLLPGQKLGQPEPLFRKLDDSLVEEERARLGKQLG
jgi:methionyl-tRNA synthetase